VACAPARIGTFGKSITGWSDESQITNPQEFHPQCRPEEVFDPKSGSCIPITNVEGSEPVGTLECPEGFVLDELLGLCTPESPTSQAQFSGPFVPRNKDIPKKLKPKDKKALEPLKDHSDVDDKAAHHSGKPMKKKKKVTATQLLREIKEGGSPCGKS
jgi:hypothetical protein